MSLRVVATNTLGSNGGVITWGTHLTVSDWQLET